MTDRLKHAPKGHGVQPRAKVGILVANLGTPDDTSYWSVRRYLSEFLSDKRVVDTPNWKWQPILQLIILTFRPTKSGRAYDSIWNKEADESPLLTITRAQTDKLRGCSLIVMVTTWWWISACATATHRLKAKSWR